MVATFGGDGTILRASSLFSHSTTVPPILSFSLGTLGFLSEFQFSEHAQAWSDVYNSSTQSSTKPARILLRNRLRVGLSPPSASPSRPSQSPPPTTKSPSPTPPSNHALNEILLHRGASPHLAHLIITLNGRPLTTAIADGLLISSPTGSTAYSLSAGGSIIHPLVKGIVVTPICARSLSFRPLVLPGEAVIGVQVGEGTRPFSAAGDAPNVSNAGKVDVSIDGVQIPGGLGVGGEVKVWGEAVGRRDEVERDWVGGVPCVMRGGEKGGDEGWVGGLNGLLKFNYPFGEEGG